MKKVKIAFSAFAIIFAIGAAVASETLVVPAEYKATATTCVPTNAPDGCAVRPNGTICTVLIGTTPFTAYDQGSACIDVLRRL